MKREQIKREGWSLTKIDRRITEIGTENTKKGPEITEKYR